jgi:hypothetical protein
VQAGGFMVGVYSGVITITIDAAGAISVDPDTLTTAPDKHIVFVIVNSHTQRHRVGVSPDHLKKNGSASDPDHPIHHILGKFHDDVEAGDVGVFSMHVKDKDTFPEHKVYSYKYTVTASDLAPYDPNIDINN